VLLLPVELDLLVGGATFSSDGICCDAVCVFLFARPARCRALGQRSGLRSPLPFLWTATPPLDLLRQQKLPSRLHTKKIFGAATLVWVGCELLGAVRSLYRRLGGTTLHIQDHERLASLHVRLQMRTSQLQHLSRPFKGV